jgi:outer membrane protein, heavy metal efflux system
MNKILLIITLIIFSITQAYTNDILDQYLEMAAKNNPELKSKYNDYLAALEVVPQISALPDPQISFAYFIQPVETRLGPQKAKISLNQMFPWFGLLGAKEDAQTNKARARFEEFEETKSKLFFNIKSMYFDFYFIKKSLDITNKNLDILNSLKSLVQTKVETGNSSALDEIYLEMEFAELQNQLYLIEDELNVLEIQFIKLLNTSEFQIVQISDSLVDTDLAISKQEIIMHIRSNNHQLKNLNYITESYQNEIYVSKISAFPNITFGIDYIVTDKNTGIPNLADNGKDAIIIPKIGFNIPLFSSKYSSKTKQMEFQKISSDNKQIDKMNEIESVFESVYKDYINANRRQILFKNQLKLTDNAMQILRSQYETGSADFEDLLNIERKILVYSLSLEKSRKDENTAVAMIKYLMGK